jgi:hypothetical protein
MNCEWSQDDLDGDWFVTDCGNDFILNDGTPEENKMKFCCYCGKPLKQILYVEENENELD